MNVKATQDFVTPITLTEPTVAFDPFAGPEILRLVPITAPQTEIWTACLLGGDDASRAYNESITLRLTGFLDYQLLRRALQAVIRRHEALRSAFSADGSYSYVLRELFVELPCQDISHEDTLAQQQLIAAYVKQEARHVFNLLAGPLVKAGLMRLSAEEHQLVLTVHHIICDGWSMGIVLQDLSHFYSAYCQNQSPNLPPTTSFSRYADQQVIFRRSPAYEQIEQFWQQQYQNAVPILDLPTDFPRPAVRTYQSARADYRLPAELVMKVKKVGISAGCSLVTTLLAAFELFLYQLTGQAEVVVGLPAAGQASAEWQRLVGHCVNLLPLRSAPGQATSFLNYLHQRKPAILAAYEHQQLTFGSLLQTLRWPRDASRVPLPVMFNIDLGLAEGIEFHGLTCQLHSNPRAYEAFELFVNVSGTEQSLVLEWSYNTGLFKPNTIDELMAGLARLLEETSRHPADNLFVARPVNHPVGLAAAYHTLNATAQSYPADQTLTQLLSAQACVTPHHPALQFGTTILSYQELHAKANQLAHYLIAQGVQVGDRIGLAIDRSPDLLISLLASLKCGATYIPLDPMYPPGRLEYMLADSEANFLLASTPDSINTKATVLPLTVALQAAAHYDVQEPNLLVASTQALYILYTSGSTGQPKGVPISHRNVVNFLCSMRQTPGISTGDRLLAITTVCFDIAVLELFLPLFSGATVVLADASMAKDGVRLLRVLEEEKITVMQATPSGWRLLLAAGWNRKLPLKVLCGGEALPIELADRLLAQSQAVWNMYGPTETTVWSTIKQLAPTENVISIGRPIANTQIYLLDERGQPVAPGAIGELCIAGAGVARGYWQRPELTSEKFRTNSFSTQPEATLYHTGDLGILLPNGELQCLGRLDQQVKIRGHRIEPGEIEYALTTLADVREAVVIACESQQGDEQLVAFVVPTTSTLPSESKQRVSTWQQSLRQTLPAHLVPSEIIPVMRIPLTLNGKIDRKALSQQFVSSHAVLAKGQYVAPRTEMERLVATVWQTYLKLPQINILDNFFEVGGHSLIAVQVMARLEKETGKRLPLATLFEHPTIEKLAVILQPDESSITWDSLVPIKPYGNKTPLYLVHGAGLNVLLFNALSKNMDIEQPVYGLQAKGLNGVDEPLTTIEEIAAHYVAEIEAINPTGPYALAGYSFGGIIAFEMAKQFLAGGKEVRFVGLLDTYAHYIDYTSPWFNRKAKQVYFLVKKYTYDLFLLSQNPKQVVTLKFASLKRKTVERIMYGKKKQYEMIYGHPYQLGIAQEIAWRRYRLTPQPIAVHIFRNTERIFYVEDFEYLGWKPFALGGISLHDIPGNHNFIFAPPNDKESAQILQKALDQSCR